MSRFLRDNYGTQERKSVLKIPLLKLDEGCRDKNIYINTELRHKMKHPIFLGWIILSGKLTFVKHKHG